MSTELRTELMELGKQTAIAIELFILGLVLGGNASEAFIVACIPYGWRVLNMITPNIFLIMPFIGWVIYFIVKMTLAAMVGVFVMAYTFIKCIIRVVIAYKRQGGMAG